MAAVPTMVHPDPSIRRKQIPFKFHGQPDLYTQNCARRIRGRRPTTTDSDSLMGSA